MIAKIQGYLNDYLWVYVVSDNETIRPQKIINTLEAMLPGSSIIISSGS